MLTRRTRETRAPSGEVVSLGPRRTKKPGLLWPYNLAEEPGFPPYSPLSLCLDFNNDTLDEYCDFGHSSDFDFERTTPFSVGIWVKYTGALGAYLLTKRDYPNAGWTLQLEGGGDAGGVQFGCYGTGTHYYIKACHSSLLNDGAWHSIIVTKSSVNGAAGITLYADGLALPGSTSGAAFTETMLNAGHLQVASVYGGTTSEYVGKACHSFVVGRELTADEVLLIGGQGSPRKLSSLGSDLRHWSALGNGDSIVDVRDLSGKGNHGYAFNLEQANPTDLSPGGTSTKSVALGGSQYANLGNVLSWERNQPFSWSFWVFAPDRGANQMIISKSLGATTYRGYEIALTPSHGIGVVLYNTYNTNALYRYATTPVGSGWHHVVVTYDGSSTAAGVKIYYDAVLQSLATALDSLSATIQHAGSLNFGRRSDASLYFIGLLDEVANYSTELSLAEVEDIYNGGHPCDLSSLSSWANNVGWWRMGDGDSLPTLTDSGNSTAHDATMSGTTGNDFVADVPTVV